VRDIARFVDHGFAPFQAAFNARDALQGQTVVLSDGQQGRAQGVGADGALLIRNERGVVRITSAEVSVRPQRTPGATMV